MPQERCGSAMFDVMLPQGAPCETGLPCHEATIAVLVEECRQCRHSGGVHEPKTIGKRSQMQQALMPTCVFVKIPDPAEGWVGGFGQDVHAPKLHLCIALVFFIYIVFFFFIPQ